MDTRGTSAWRWTAGLAAASLLVCGTPVAEQLAVMAAETAPERLPDDVVKPAGGYRQYNKSDSTDCPSCFAREQAVKKRLELQKQGLLQPSKPPSTFTGKISNLLSQPRDLSERATGPIPKTEMAGSNWTGVNTSPSTNGNGVSTSETSAGQSRIGQGPVAQPAAALEVEFQPNRAAVNRSHVQPVAAPDTLVAQARPKLAPVAAGNQRAQGAPQQGQYQQPGQYQQAPRQQQQFQQQQPAAQFSAQQQQPAPQYPAQQFAGEQYVQETDPATLMLANEPPPTAIERELEKLFGKDGREAPPMRFSQMEAASGDDEAAEMNFRAAAPQPMQSNPTAGQNVGQSADESQQAPKKSFFKRLIPSFLRREEKPAQPVPQAAKSRPASQQPWKPGQPVPGGQPLPLPPRFNPPQQLPAGVANGPTLGNAPQNLSQQYPNQQGAPQPIANQPHPLHVQPPHPIADMVQPNEQQLPQQPAIQQQPAQRIPELSDAEPIPAGKSSRNPGSEEDGFRLDDEQTVDQQRLEKLDADLLIDDVLPGTSGAKSTAKSPANKLKPKTPPVAAKSLPPVTDLSTSTVERPAGKPVADAAKPAAKPVVEKVTEKPAQRFAEKMAPSALAATPEKIGDVTTKPKADSPFTGLSLDLAEAERRVATDSRTVIVDDEDLQLPAAATKVAVIEKSVENGTSATVTETSKGAATGDIAAKLPASPDQVTVSQDTAAKETVTKESVALLAPPDAASTPDTAVTNSNNTTNGNNEKPRLVEIPQPTVSTNANESTRSADRNDVVADNAAKRSADAPTASSGVAANTGTESAPVKNERDPAVMQARIAARGDLKGFKGFCPVTLRNERRLVDAKPEFRAEHQGRSYYVSSAEALEQFHQNPEKYVPACDGRDVVQQVSGAVVVEGSLDHAAWFKGRLYLFATADARVEFVSAPAEFVKKTAEPTSSETDAQTAAKNTGAATDENTNSSVFNKTDNAPTASPAVTTPVTAKGPPSLDDEPIDDQAADESSALKEPATNRNGVISAPQTIGADRRSTSDNAPSAKVDTVPSLDDAEPSFEDRNTHSTTRSDVNRPALVAPGAEGSSKTTAPKTTGFRPLAAPTTTTIGTPVSKLTGTGIPPAATAPVAAPVVTPRSAQATESLAAPGTAAVASPAASGLPQKGTVIARPAIRPAPRNPNVVPPAKTVPADKAAVPAPKNGGDDRDLDDEEDDLDLE